MAGFYDREEGVAWGPVTKEEMLDDLLLYGPKIVQNRKTLGCNPTFENKLSRFDHLHELHTKSDDSKLQDGEVVILSSDEEEVSSKLQDGVVVMLSSDEEEESECLSKNTICTNDVCHDDSCYNSDIKELQKSSLESIKISIDNIEANNINVKDRLPTPANLDEDTYDEICDYNEENSISDINESRLSSQHNGSASSSDKTRNLNEQDVIEKHYLAYYNITEQHQIYRTESEIEDEGNLLHINEPRLSSQHNENASSSDETRITEQHQIYRTESEIENEENLLDPSSSKLQSPPQASSNESNLDEDVFNDTLAEMERLLNQQELNDSYKGENLKTDSENISIQYEICHVPSVKIEECLANQTVDSICSDTYDLSFGEKPRSLSSMSGEVPSPKMKPMTLLPSGTKPKSAMKSALPIYYNRKAPIIKATPNNVRSPIFSENTCGNKNIKFTFLTPTNSKQQFLQPASKSTSSKKRFKNIESPVLRYIKNAGTAPLFQKVTPSKPLNSEAVEVIAIRSCSKENSFTIPEVVYKPAKHAIVTKDKVMKMPKNIESLIPHKPNVIKHLGRTGQSSRETISRRLLEDDLTVNGSFNTTEDTSIHFTKTAYIS